MDTLYRFQVGESLYNDGLVTWMSHGTPITVDGVAMVRTEHGTIVPSEGWSTDEHDARLRAAMTIEKAGWTLIAQAERMRAAGSRKEAVA